MNNKSANPFVEFISNYKRIIINTDRIEAICERPDSKTQINMMSGEAFVLSDYSIDEVYRAINQKEPK